MSYFLDHIFKQAVTDILSLRNKYAITMICHCTKLLEISGHKFQKWEHEFQSIRWSGIQREYDSEMSEAECHISYKRNT